MNITLITICLIFIKFLLHRAEREISQVKTSKARSSQFRETRSQARTSAVRTSSAHAAMTQREPFPVPATAASTSSTSAASESAAFPARARSKSGVLTKEEEEIKRKVLQQALERASNYQVNMKHNLANSIIYTPDNMRVFFGQSIDLALLAFRRNHAS